MRYKHVLSRRTLIRGATGVTVGLPFLEEMRSRSLFAAEEEGPVRAFNIFFGLGYQREIQNDRMTKRDLLPIEPLVDKFKSKLAFLTKVDQVLGWGGGNAHYDGAAVAFTGTNADAINRSKSVTGGASIDQALRLHVHPNQLPAGVFPAIDTGTWWRFSDSNNRYIHSRNANGQPAGDPVPPQTPPELFKKVFGSLPGGMVTQPMQDPAAAAEARRKLAMRHSVLDSVVEQYKHVTSEAGNLGPSSRTTLREHFDAIRALEQEVAGTLSIKDGDPVVKPAEPVCQVPAAPSGTFYPHRNGGDGNGIDVTVERLEAEVRLMARLFAQGIACDRIRFGSFIFQSGGERIRLKGRYMYNGQTVTEFNDRETSHEYWHRNDFTWSRRHLHFMLNQIAFLLELMDGIKEPNGKSVLDTAMITITTESGSGVHGSKEQELNGVLHIIGGANGRFRVGGNDFIDVNATGIDLYNTMLMAYGVPKNKRLWDGRGDVSGKIMA